ncbi:DUF58 domain-containing protein [Aquibacillus saliphilus]|uniref:DUF58 domain-containing protein n=1 Tax=Aquibacillus saliphilus TaxID=1909422 RepID=UPI001CEFDA2F|nr:DUF58 domain-containing protein [Aquibacillus saliphilus]
MSLGWFITLLVLFVLIQSFIYQKWGLTNIQYTRSFSERTVFEGEQVEMIDQITNMKILPVPWVRLDSKINRHLLFPHRIESHGEEENELFHHTLFSLIPYQKVTRRHKVICGKRGYYRLNTVSISTGDAFGFGENFQLVPALTDITVYPAFIPIDQVPLPSHSWLGEIVVRRWIIEDPFVHAGVREFSQGDSINSINWKVTARTNHLQVNKKDYTADHHLMIYLNFDETEDIWLPIEDEKLFERGLSYAASICQYAISQGISTGFGCNSYLVEPFGGTEKIKDSVRINPKSNASQLTLILDTMAKLKMARSRNFNYFLKEDIDMKMENTDILLITTIMTEQMQINIRQLEMLGNSVEILWLQKNQSTYTTSGEQNVI